MTIKIKITNEYPADHPLVAVETVDDEGKIGGARIIIEPFRSHECYIYSGQNVLVKEYSNLPDDGVPTYDTSNKKLK